MALPFLATLAINLVAGLALQGLATLIGGRRSGPTPAPTTTEGYRVPRTDHGRPVRRVHGTVLIRDPQVNGHSPLRVEAIRSKGGKK
ncbi:MAG: hypothetical protein AAFR44_00535 [Pseudomonadota bacterium]